MSQTSIKNAVKALLERIEAGDAETQAGGAATWAKRPRRKQAYWFVNIREIRERDYTLGARAHADHLVVIEGWMPLSYAGRSTAAWDEKVDAVRDALRNAETLDGAASETGNPDMIRNDFDSIGGGGSAEVACHHCVIEFRAGEEIEYELK
jgi:hypothetical protein